MIDWNLAPEGAEKLVQRKSHVTWAKGLKLWDEIDERWCDSLLEWQTIATRPTQKTVADAVEFYRGVWPDDTDDRIYYYFDEQIFESHHTDWGDDDKSVLVCTRAEFEAYVKEQEGEKWTHVTSNGTKCNIVVDTPDVHGRIIAIDADGEYLRHAKDDLKPIKPTMTAQDEAALVEFMKSSHKLEVINEVRAYIREHEII